MVVRSKLRPHSYLPLRLISSKRVDADDLPREQAALKEVAAGGLVGVSDPVRSSSWVRTDCSNIYPWGYYLLVALLVAFLPAEAFHLVARPSIGSGGLGCPEPCRTVVLLVYWERFISQELAEAPLRRHSASRLAT